MPAPLPGAGGARLEDVLRPPALLRAACLGVGLVSAAGAAAETVSVLTASPESEPAAAYFTQQISVKVVRRESVHARSTEALINEARARWRDDFVVVVDAERAVVTVLRPRDGTVGARTLAPSAARAPYAVALAAVELLDIVRSAPRARAAALPAQGPESLESRLSLDLGLVQSVSETGDVGMLQPTAGADLELQGNDSPYWFAIGAHATGLLPMRREQLLVLPEGPDDRGSFEYARNELSARTSVGHRGADGTVSLGLDLGVAFIDATAEDGEGRTIVSDSREAFWLGLTGDLRYALSRGFSLGAGVGAAWSPVATRFLASPRGAPAKLLAFAEGQLDFRARFALYWGVEL